MKHGTKKWDRNLITIVDPEYKENSTPELRTEDLNKPFIPWSDNKEAGRE